jgi:hypothetical protein
MQGTGETWTPMSSEKSKRNHDKDESSEAGTGAEEPIVVKNLL